MADTLVIDRRFNGPPASGHGGYTAGLLAARLDGCVEVSLRRPIPLDAELVVERPRAGYVTLSAAGEVVAEAWPAELDLEVPPVPSEADCEQATERYVGRFHRLAFTACFGCGVTRESGAGLRVFAGPTAREGTVATPWIPHAAFADARGRIRPEFVWSALDCPGGFAVMGQDLRPVFTARLTARIDHAVMAGAPYRVMAWLVERAGRKAVTGAALIARDDTICAIARALWIEPRGDAKASDGQQAGGSARADS